MQFRIAVVTLLGATCCAHAQLRIVQYNLGTVKDSTSTVLEQIGRESVNGIARPIDVLVVQEQESAGSVAQIVSTMNSIYGPGTYTAAPFTGISSGGGMPAMVYRTSSVNLVSSPLAIGTVGGSSNARQTVRYQLRPAGYGSAADIFLYASHFKASDSGSDAARRNAEAISNRANADALGAGKNILYVGDFNLYSGSEAAYQTLTSAGNGRAIDPSGAPLNWSGSVNRIYHTQSPATSSAYPGQITGGMNDRFDFQLSSVGMNDGNGVAIIPGSYRVFGNNGTHPHNGAINSGSNTWTNPGLTVSRATVLNALAGASDHVPVVADYQLPARMSVAVGSTPSHVIAGANVSVNLTVSNSAPVLTPNGADELLYNISSGGAVAGSADGIATASLTGQTHALSLDTSTPGLKTGTITVTSTSEAAASANFSRSIATTVLAHATPSFTAEVQTTSLTIDFGIRARGLPAPIAQAPLFNLATPDVTTAALDLDEIAAAGDAARLSDDFAANRSRSPGGVDIYSLELDTSSNGAIHASYTLFTSDQDLPGAINHAPLTIDVLARVATGGDANLDGRVDTHDLAALAGAWQQAGGWEHGDFNRDNIIDVSDLALLALNWQADGHGLDSVSFSDALAQFALPSGDLPEPGILLLPVAGLLALARRRGAKDRSIAEQPLQG